MSCECSNPCSCDCLACSAHSRHVFKQTKSEIRKNAASGLYEIVDLSDGRVENSFQSFGDATEAISMLTSRQEKP